MKKPSFINTWLPKILLSLTLALLLWIVTLAQQTYSFSKETSSGPADAAVVLGAAVFRERPSPVFRERINHGIDLYLQGQVGKLIFTGGVGTRDDLAESEAARLYAIDQGVSDEDILIETLSDDTHSNLVQAAVIIKAQGFESVLIVSDPMHMLRAMTIAEDIGLNALPSPTPTSRYRSSISQLTFLIREVYFLAAYTLVYN